MALCTAATTSFTEVSDIALPEKGIPSRLTQRYQETTTTRSLRNCRRTGRESTRITSLRLFFIVAITVGLGTGNTVAAGVITAAAARAVGAIRWKNWGRRLRHPCAHVRRGCVSGCWLAGFGYLYHLLRWVLMFAGCCIWGIELLLLGLGGKCYPWCR